jgi:hypothetical protein
MVREKKRVGLEFEEAVYRFVNSLDSHAQVLFNHSVRDRDTCEPRQCDVWIEAKLWGHWPISILVSCKDHKRKLHSGDIGAFLDEIRSTGATTGVIYSRSGFTEPALLKAKVNGYSCCRLYQHEPADIPGSFYFEQFACSTQIHLDFKTENPDSALKTWGDIFAIKHETGTVLDWICQVIADAEVRSIEEIKTNTSFPSDWAMEMQFSYGKSNDLNAILVFGHWKKYKARLEATLLNGSYCLTNNSFQGTQYGPCIDTHSAHPGESWTEIKDENIILPINRMIAILYHRKVKDDLQMALGSVPLHKKL